MKLNQRGFGAVEILIVVAVVLAILAGSPVISANIWKSSTLEKTNTAVNAINKAGEAVKEFDAKAEATSADFDNLIATYKKERTAIESAKEKSKSVGGFKGLDLTSSYKKAADTSNKLTRIYNELLGFNAAETASAEAEKQLILAFERSGSPNDARGMQAQAQSIRAANNDYQKYLGTGQASEVEKKFSGVLTKLADALVSSAQATSANNVAQINNAESQLQTVLKELEALEPERAAQTAANQQKLQTIIDRLNTVSKELE